MTRNVGPKAFVVLCAGLWSGLCASPFAQAEVCEANPSTVLETFPASGSHDAPRNGAVTVVYCPPEDPLVDRNDARLLVVDTAAAEGCSCPLDTECLEASAREYCVEPVAAQTDVVGDILHIQTDPLLADTRYIIEAPEPSGPWRVLFTTGHSVDESPPEFNGLSRLRVLGCGPGFGFNPACPEDNTGFVVILEAAAAVDDAGGVNIVYTAYQVRDGQLIERGSSRGDGTEQVTMSTFVPFEALSAAEMEHICFTMTAADPYGHETGSDTLCVFTPEYSPFASACQMGSMPGAAPPFVVTLGLVAVIVLWRRFLGPNAL